jgi:tRNA C32,U32 (ribose-2'-O)-methylase TrmJ
MNSIVTKFRPTIFSKFTPTHTPRSVQEIIGDVVTAMDFLRNCGSTNGDKQADAIQRLISRYRADADELENLRNLIREKTPRHG